MSTTSQNMAHAPPAIAMVEAALPTTFAHASSHSSRAAEDGLRHARNEQHVNDERDEDHQARDEIGNPHLHRIVAVEGLLEKRVHESGPHKDEGGGYGTNHREADEHVEEVEELRSEGLCHQQRNEDRAKQCSHAVEDEGAAIDDEQDRRCEAKHDLHNEVAKDLNWSGERWHSASIASSLEKLEELVERVLIEGRHHRLGDVGKEVVDAEARAGKRIHPIIQQQAADDEPQQKVASDRPHERDAYGSATSSLRCSS